MGHESARRLTAVDERQEQAGELAGSHELSISGGASTNEDEISASWNCKLVRPRPQGTPGDSPPPFPSCAASDDVAHLLLQDGHRGPNVNHLQVAAYMVYKRDQWSRFLIKNKLIFAEKELPSTSSLLYYNIPIPLVIFPSEIEALVSRSISLARNPPSLINLHLVSLTPSLLIHRLPISYDDKWL